MNILDTLLVALVWVNEQAGGLLVSIGFWHFTVLVFALGVYTGVALSNHQQRLLEMRRES